MSNNGISGRRMTFYQLLNEHSIQIPIIQRDYAQGRQEESEVREGFLKALYTYLDEGLPFRDLDFIYGSQSYNAHLDSKSFVPLDGQQRLTTLLLLHWYLGLKEDSEGKLKIRLIHNAESENPKSRFSYETRTSSREFCDALVSSNNIDFNEFHESSPSSVLKDKSWFYHSWIKDPTIEAMLIMLDDIHLIFKESNGFLSKLIDEDIPIITFQFLDLDEFNLTDDLYIKMNARGVPLTPFENFKAKLEQYIDESNLNKEESYELLLGDKIESVTFKDYFAYKIDTDWANFFWKSCENNREKYDNSIMNFLRVIVSNVFSDNSISNDYVRTLLDRKIKSISFGHYNKLGIFTSHENKENLKDKEALHYIVGLLDLICQYDVSKEIYLTDYFYYSEPEAFQTILNYSFLGAGYVERIKFHAYSKYILRNSNNGSFTDVEGLKKWMRVIFNLVENTAPYNNEREFIRSIESVNELAKFANNIEDYLINNGSIDGFDKDQIKEERRKACLIKADDSWRELIENAESHNYFKGQIGVLLFLSNIEELTDGNQIPEWSIEENENYKNQFRSNNRKLDALFDENGLRDFNDYLVERALLSIDDYLIDEGQNQSFLINNDRDISWKRLLKRDKKTNHNTIIKTLFDKVEPDNVENSLRGMIDTSIIGWRGLFINNISLCEYVKPGKRYVRKKSSQGFILFNGGERMNGAHAELYTYDFYLKNILNKDYIPFKNADYFHAIGDSPVEAPCAYLDSWKVSGENYALDISYNTTAGFEIKVFNRNSTVVHPTISDLLNNSGFLAHQNQQGAFYITCGDEYSTKKELEKLCQNLNELDL